MSFVAKQLDWRNQPVEVRERLLVTLRKQNPTAAPDAFLTVSELAQACGINPDPWQQDLFESDHQEIILNCCRQSGKSTCSAILALHQLCFVPNSLSLILAPSTRQSSETYRKIRDFYNSLAHVPEVIAESSLKLELANGARAQVLPGKESTVRGFSNPALVIVDEAARVEDELYEAIRPMLAVSRGRLILLSTPFGSRGFFWQEWVEGGPEWKRVRVTADQCPRISKDYLEKERQRGDWFFRQEYLCEFVDSLEACFSTVDIEAAITSEVEPLWKL